MTKFLSTSNADAAVAVKLGFTALQPRQPLSFPKQESYQWRHRGLFLLLE